jgi:flagellar basal body rod protein FlgG
MTQIASQVSSAINGLTREFETIANNLANVNTAGYKRRSNAFSKALSEQGAGSKSDLE